MLKNKILNCIRLRYFTISIAGNLKNLKIVNVLQFYNFNPFPILSHDVPSVSEITPCVKINKPLVVYRFSGNVIK